MLDKLVSLAIENGEAHADAEVEVEVLTNAPQSQNRLRLWDAHGRDPRSPVPSAGTPNRWRLGKAPELVGCTLTWSVRLAPSRFIAGTDFELRLRVFKAGRLLPGGDFLYSGPLDGLEERNGRFHFTGKA